MSESSLNSRRIAKNTIALYVRLLFTLVIGLYTSRVILQALGFSDYGLYNVVGGFVSLFGFLNHSLSAGTQRFLSMSIGKKDEKETKDVFASSLYLHLCLSGIVFLLAQTIGLWFVMTKMNIEADRMVAAIWVFEFSIIASIIQIVQVPFMSSLIAHEKMDVYAYISILEVVLKLLVVFLIQVASFDKLIFYAFLILLVHLVIALLYNVYCRKHYTECSFSLRYDKRKLKEVASFSGWGIIGMMATTCQGQGINVLLNMLFGSVVNAARGLAFQVNNIILQFANNFLTAVNPQIFKLYANNETEKLFKLIKTSALMAAYLLLLLMMPLFVDIEYVLGLWLGKYPAYTASFIRIVFIQSIMSAIIRPVVLLIFAVGKMKMPNIVGGSLVLMAIPLAYISYKLGGNPTVVFIAGMVPWLFEEFSDLFFARKYIGFPMLDFYLNVYGRVAFIGCILYFLISSFYGVLHLPRMANFIIMAMVSVLFSTLVIYFVGIDKQTRKVVNTFVWKKYIAIKERK